MTGVNITLYIVTDWMGIVPLLVCLAFAAFGFAQLVKRKSVIKVDSDILILGVYYVLVIICYFYFEMNPVNYRPVLIDGYLEASYPSSTTLLVMSVMPTLYEQLNRRMRDSALKYMIQITIIAFTGFVVTGRLICGVHWFTDIVGSVLFCAGLFMPYLAAVAALKKPESDQRRKIWS